MITRLRELYRYRELLRNLVIRDLKIKYKGSVIGFLWSLVNPILMITVYTIAFKYIIKMKVPNFPAFFTIGIISWNFLAMSLSSSVSIVVGNADLIKKVYFPREILPIAVVLSNFVELLLTLLVLFPALVLFKVHLRWFVVFLPLLFLLQILFNTGVSLLFSCLNVFFRDVAHFVGVLLLAWFWICPIVYPLHFIPERLHRVYLLNPMAIFIACYRDLLFWSRLPTPSLMVGLLLSTLATLFVGYYVFCRYEHRFAEEV